MPASTDANAGGVIGDASTLGINTSAVESVTAERIPGTGEAEAGIAEASLSQSRYSGTLDGQEPDDRRDEILHRGSCSK